MLAATYAAESRKLGDPRAVGLTVVVRDEPEFFAMGSTSSLERTEFHWKHDDGVKMLEIEEISPVSTFWTTAT